MSIRHSKSSVRLRPKPLRWAFHHGAGRLNRARGDDRRFETEEQRTHIVDAGDGGLVAPDLSSTSDYVRDRQPPPHDYSQPAGRLAALIPAYELRDEDGAGGPIWAALLGSNTSEAMRRLAQIIFVLVIAFAVVFWLLA